MTKEEFAALMAGATYDNFIRSDELMKGKNAEAIAKQHGLVVVFGASDDLMEFRGAIHDELGAYGGTTAYVTQSGLLANDCDNEDCPHFEKMKATAKTIEACWDVEGYSWIFKTDIPHATFEITEDDEPYCRGIVFELAAA